MAKKSLKKWVKSAAKKIVRSAKAGASSRRAATAKTARSPKADKRGKLASGAKKAPAAGKAAKVKGTLKASKPAVSQIQKKPPTATKTVAAKAVSALTKKTDTKKAAPATKAAIPAPVSAKGAAGKAAAAKGKTDSVALAIAAPVEKAKAKRGRPAGSHVIASAKVAAKSLNQCREIACDSTIVGAGYCRLHYIKNWKRVKNKEAILAEGKLNRFIEELVLKYPDKYIEAIRFDLSSEPEFAKVVLDLNLAEPIVSEEYAGDDDAAAIVDDGIIDSIKKESIEEISEEF